MGSTVSMPPAPPPPAQIDPGQSSIDFIRAMSDPALQQQMLSAEQTYRPQYTQLELADINTILRGGGGQMGLLELNQIASQQAQQQAQEAASAQRAADIADVEALGGRASQAFLQANPQLANALAQAETLRTSGGIDVASRINDLVTQGLSRPEATQIAQTELGSGLQQAGMQQLQAAPGEQQLTQAGLDILGRGANLSPLQARNAVQQARIASQARGRIGDMSSMYGEVGARLAAEMDLESRNLGLGSQLISQGFGMGQQRLSAASGLYGQDLARAQANQQAALSASSLGLQGLMGLGQLQQSQTQADRAYAMNLIAANQATASDPFQAILGRPAQAPGMGMASTQLAAGLAGQQLGPNLFDPNAGINLALQQQANLANYQSSLYGAQAGYAGATNQGRGALIGGIAGGIGAFGAGGLVAL